MAVNGPCALFSVALRSRRCCPQVVEGNQYFPPDAIRKEYFQPSSTTSYCPWKGTAKYYSVAVNGKVSYTACPALLACPCIALTYLCLDLPLSHLPTHERTSCPNLLLI